jgi:hypothetical protein
MMNSSACTNNCESQETPVTAQHTPEIRIEKILAVRRQLGEGRYCLAEKLDVVVDRILEELLNR